jgi:hypothetical protein
MATSEWIGSIARCTAFGTGAVLLHAAIAWAMPEAAPRISLSDGALLWIEHAPSGPDAPIGGSADGAALGLPADPGASAAPAPRAATAPNAARRNRALPNTTAQPDEATTQIVAARAASDVAAGAPAADLAAETMQAETAASGASPSSSAAASLVGGEQGSAASGQHASTNLGAVGGGAPGAAGMLGHGPALLALSNPCTGYFPEDAHVDQGEVQLDVTVDASGHTHASAVLAEQPRGQGFASAAHDCARRLQFAPAVSERGAPMAGHARLKLRFKRRTS